MKLSKKILLGAATLLLAGQALANPCPPGNPPTNCAPPPGAILDLHSQPIPGSYMLYSLSFMATDTTTNLSFAFRDDPAFIFLDDVSVSTGGGPNLLTNPGFEDGPVGSNTPSGWTYLNSFGASFAGFVSTNSPHSGSNNYYDGAVQAYDGITQAIATTIGTIYDVSFWMYENSDNDIFRRVSDNGNVTDTGGNGIDLLVYAGAVPTLPAVPEPPLYVLLGLGLVATGWLQRRRAR